MLTCRMKADAAAASGSTMLLKQGDSSVQSHDSLEGIVEDEDEDEDPSSASGRLMRFARGLKQADATARRRVLTLEWGAALRADLGGVDGEKLLGLLQAWWMAWPP